MSTESFVYLYRDSKNKKFYLGKHKGSPNDDYTHSSTVMERFSKNNQPKHIKRRILCYGTDPEMCELEQTLLKNRKSKCWDKYHNVSVGFPYRDQWSYDNSRWNYGGGEWSKVRSIKKKMIQLRVDIDYAKDAKLECSKKIRKLSHKSTYEWMNEMGKDELISCRERIVDQIEKLKCELAQLEYKQFYALNPGQCR